MRKILGLSCIAVLALSLAACSKDEAAPAAAVTLTVKGSTQRTATTASLQTLKWLDSLVSRVGVSSVQASPATSGTPANVRIKLYAVWLSESEECTNPVLVQDYGATPVEKNLSAGDTLFSGSPANGTYKCVILKIQDVLTFNADQTAVTDWSGVCADTTTDYSFDIYRVGSDPSPWVDMDGNSITATGTNSAPGADTVYLYATTKGSAPTGKSDNQTATLLAPLTIPSTATFYADFTDGIQGISICKIEGTDGNGFGFR